MPEHLHGGEGPLAAAERRPTPRAAVVVEGESGGQAGGRGTIGGSMVDPVEEPVGGIGGVWESVGAADPVARCCAQSDPGRVVVRDLPEPGRHAGGSVRQAGQPGQRVGGRTGFDGHRGGHQSIGGGRRP